MNGEGIENDVRVFTLASWARWEQEKPDWFTDGFKAGVPNDFIPESRVDELNGKSMGGGVALRDILAILLVLYIFLHSTPDGYSPSPPSFFT